MNPPEGMSREEKLSRLRAWRDRIETARFFGGLKADFRIDSSGMLRFAWRMKDGPVTVTTTPFFDHVDTMKFASLVEKFKVEAMACIGEHFDRTLAPELVFEGTSPVKYTDERNVDWNLI